ncbi:MAG TPA: tetratricopeptide repeat protein [Opitutaceae bacterium]|jgi:tetratricopeptide (TPR) repeat protein|nr:tetratricopeptide repeat protein [Opitutaceae bacterium]
MESRLASAAFVLVFAVYLFLASVGGVARYIPEPRENAFNSLSRGLLSGHLYTTKEVPPGLAALADPYDPSANVEFRTNAAYMVHDYSYYKGRMYLYFGVAPALLLFIPFHLLTGSWLSQWMAVALLCTAGLLVNVLLVRSVKKAFFPGSPAWILAASVLLLGFGSYAPILLARADKWEVPIAFSYLFVSLTLRFLWEALGHPEKCARWVALASLSLGIAFAGRPSVLPVGAILLLPFLLPEPRKSLRTWAAAILPLGFCGLGVALYNQMRFSSPFDFGQRYQLAAEKVSNMKIFSLEYLGANLNLFLFKAVDWRSYFPFANEPAYGASSKNHGMIEHLSGALLNDPVLWAALAIVAFVIIRRPGARLGLFVAAAGWAFLSALTLMALFCGICSRYQFEFLPALALLAALGVMAAENALTGGRLALARCVWIPALIFSSAFTVLYSVNRIVEDHGTAAIVMTSKGDLRDANHEVEIDRFLSPGDPLFRLESGVIMVAAGHQAAAQSVFAALTRDFPDYGLGHYNLGRVLATEGRTDEAIAELAEARRLAPDNMAVARDLNEELAKRGPGNPR